jgi:hypothetical protein
MAVIWHVALIMEAVSSSEMSVIIYQTTQHNIPEDNHLHTRRQNLKSHQSRAAGRLSLLCFVMVLFSTTRKILVGLYYLKTRHECFLSHPFQFIIHESFDVGIYRRVHTALKPRMTTSTSSLRWEPQSHMNSVGSVVNEWKRLGKRKIQVKGKVECRTGEWRDARKVAP